MLGSALYNDLTDDVIFLAANHVGQLGYSFQLQVRTFKTRSSDSEGFTGRRQSEYDTSFEALDEPEFNRSGSNNMNASRTPRKEKDKLRFFKSTDQTSELKNLLNDSMLNEKDRQKLRVRVKNCEGT